MGTWGQKLYEDDLAEDIRDRVKDLFKQGISNGDIVERITEEYFIKSQDSDEAPVFWFALADSLWELGVLPPTVKNRAIEYIDKEVDLKRWLDAPSQLYWQRSQELQNLKHKLNSTNQPITPKRRSGAFYNCEWQNGDVFAFPMISDHAKQLGLEGNYFVIQKADDGIWYPAHKIPIVRVKLTKDGILPKTKSEFDRMEYIQTSVTRYEDRFLPYDGRLSIEEQIAERSKTEYIVDEYGYLPQYRVQMITTSKRNIPKALIYLGNFLSAAPPQNEFIPHDKLSILSCTWNDFEERLIGRYKGYNLRQYDIYSS